MEEDNKCKNGNKPDAGSKSSESEELLGRCYEICIGGKLDSSWSDWFDGFELTSCGKDRTTLRGFVADQAALIGILNKLCRLNLTLVSVNEVARNERSACSGHEGGE